jgi:DNA polymerase-3 subunit epsilon
MSDDFIHLDRPLAVFDIEATGTNPRTDRILELAIVTLFPSGRREVRSWMFNPCRPIPIDSIAIHGITDEMVADCPTFAERALSVSQAFEGCDLGGYNHTRFDIPILQEEFARVDMPFDVDGRRIFDAQRIFHKREPRDLTAAVKFYCDGADLVDAHGAEADARATVRVLEGQFRKYPDLPRDPDELDRLINERDPFNVDRAGRLRWLDDEVTINFGKKKGEKVRDLLEHDKGFLHWITKAAFPLDTRQIITDILKHGKWPTPPPVTPSSAPAHLHIRPGSPS